MTRANKEVIRNKLLKAYKRAMVAFFAVLVVLVSIYGIGYMQGDTSLAESTMRPFVSLLLFLCVLAVACGIGASMIQGKRPGNQ